MRKGYPDLPKRKEGKGKITKRVYWIENHTPWPWPVRIALCFLHLQATPVTQGECFLWYRHTTCATFIGYYNWMQYETLIMLKFKFWTCMKGITLLVHYLWFFNNSFTTCYCKCHVMFLNCLFPSHFSTILNVLLNYISCLAIYPFP